MTPFRQTIDDFSSTYEIANEQPLKKDRPLLVEGTRQSIIRGLSPIEFPPSPAHTDKMTEIRPSSSSSSIGSVGMAGNQINEIMIPLARGAPGDEAIVAKNKTKEEQEIAKRRSQYFGHVFAVREPHNSARERISKECLVLMEIKTNVIIQDEYSLITATSYKLSELFKRPESSIVVTLSHSSCLLFGGSFEPAYVLTVSCVQTQMTPVMNMRNGCVLQNHMQDNIGVVPERGMVKFEALSEANFATNGKTLQWQIEDLEKETEHNNTKPKRTLSNAGKEKRKNTKSMRNLRTSSMLPTHAEQEVTPPSSSGTDAAPPPPPIPISGHEWDEKSDRVRKMSRRKSFSAWMFGKKGQQA